MLIDIAEEKVIILSSGIDFCGPFEEWAQARPLFWQSLWICTKSKGINRYQGLQHGLFS